MSDRDSLLAKVQKLMALAESANEHEAALAAAKAQELIQNYNIEQHELEQKTGRKAEPVGIQPVDWPDPNNVDRWEKDLFIHVCRAFFCEPVWNPRQMLFVGRPTDALVAEYTWAHVREKLVALAKTRTSNARRTGYVSNPKKWRRDWLLGAVNGVQSKLAEQKRAAQQTAGGMALVLVRDAEVKEALPHLFGKLRNDRAPRIDINGDAYYDGRDHGRRLDINPGITDNNPSRRRLS